MHYLHTEDGIRDYKVTGVQTCALPISRTELQRAGDLSEHAIHIFEHVVIPETDHLVTVRLDQLGSRRVCHRVGMLSEIGRASCRERVEDVLVVCCMNKTCIHYIFYTIT